MRSDLVELLAPISDHHLAFPQGVEHFPSEAFPAELVVKALRLPSGRTPSEHVAFGSGPSRSARFHVIILPGTARVDGEGLDPCLLQPVPQEEGDELPRSARPSAGYLRSAPVRHYRFFSFSSQFVGWLRHPQTLPHHNNPLGSESGDHFWLAVGKIDLDGLGSSDHQGIPHFPIGPDE
jgi:hypothetical protein